MVGNLYVVATPIGNLSDFSPRAIETLRKVAVIAAEDTRHSSLLLQHCGISTPLISLHQHNEMQRSEELIARLKAGEAVALISDAGTPLISDPGASLVALAHQHKLPVVAIPGPCAAIAALSISGLACEQFVFEGFLPAKGNQRKERLTELAKETRPVILYESVHRIMDLLELIVAICGAERKLALARELTKRFESALCLSASELLQHFVSHPDQVKGEFVVILDAYQGPAPLGCWVDTEAVLKLLLAELPLKQAVSLVAGITGERQNILYAKALKIKG